MLKIRDLRTEKGWTQKELAEKVQSSNKNVWAWEKGISAPDVEMLITLAKTFDVSVDYLVGNSEDDFGAVRLPAQSVLPEDEQQLLRYYRQASAEDKKSIMRIASSLTSDVLSPAIKRY